MSRVSARANSVVRVKDDRQALKAFSCAQCDKFYETVRTVENRTNDLVYAISYQVSNALRSSNPSR